MVQSYKQIINLFYVRANTFLNNNTMLALHNILNNNTMLALHNNALLLSTISYVQRYTIMRMLL